MSLPRIPVLIISVVACAACSPGRLAPPYLDVRGLAVQSEKERHEGIERLREAVIASGWHVVSADSASVIRTAARDVSGGVTRAEASIELIPLSRGFVRVYVHASRWNLLGVRSKVYHLSTGLRREILGDLEAELVESGFTTIDPERERRRR